MHLLWTSVVPDVELLQWSFDLSSVALLRQKNLSFKMLKRGNKHGVLEMSCATCLDFDELLNSSALDRMFTLVNCKVVHGKKFVVVIYSQG